jgi:hypothetical protein
VKDRDPRLRACLLQAGGFENEISPFYGVKCYICMSQIGKSIHQFFDIY